MAFLIDNPTIETGLIRNLDEVFVISPTAPSLVVYTIELTVRAPLLSSDAAQVRLLVSNVNPPEPVLGQIFGEVRVQSAQLAGLGLVSIEVKQRQTLAAWVPAGWFVILALTADGTGAAAIVGVNEVTFG